MLPRFRHLLLFGLSFALVAATTTSATAAKKRSARKGIITKPTFDPDAEKIGVFEGIESERLDVRVIADGPHEGRILIENKTDKPLSVELPEAFVTVQVLKQFGGGGGGGFGGGQQGGGGGQGGGGQQAQGGGGGGQQGGGGGGGQGGGGGGQGFFSVPAEQIVGVDYNATVCLEHGKADPTPKSTYRLVRLEDYTDDKALQELLKLVATGKINRSAAQAATWHLTDDMSWQELANKKVRHVGGRGSTPYFNRRTLVGAQQLVALAEKKAEEAGGEKKDPKRRSRVDRSR